MTLYRAFGGFFEKVHPVTKLLALILSFIPPFLSDDPVLTGAYLAMLVLAAGPAGAWPHLRRSLKLLATLMIMSLILWNMFHQGSTVSWTWGPLRVGREALLFGLTVGLRLISFIVAALIFLTSTPLEDFTFALTKMGLPFRPAFVLTLAFRLTPLFIETGRDIVQAQQARGLDLNAGGLWTRLKRHVPIIVPVLVSGLRRGDQLAMALESRGLGHTARRSNFQEYRLTWRDPILLAVLLGVAGGMVIYGQ